MPKVAIDVAKGHDKFVILATFLPVLAGQSGNTGCQALAVTVRGITLGDIKSGGAKLLLVKEFALGMMNGAVTGVRASGGEAGGWTRRSACTKCTWDPGRVCPRTAIAS